MSEDFHDSFSIRDQSPSSYRQIPKLNIPAKAKAKAKAEALLRSYSLQKGSDKLGFRVKLPAKK